MTMKEKADCTPFTCFACKAVTTKGPSLSVFLVCPFFDPTTLLRDVVAHRLLLTIHLIVTPPDASQHTNFNPGPFGTASHFNDYFAEENVLMISLFISVCKRNALLSNQFSLMMPIVYKH